MNKKIKRTLAVLTVALHVLTFSGPLHAIDIPEGTKVTLDQLPDGSTINVIGTDGNPNAAGRGILEVMNQVVISQGLDVVGIVALLAQMGIHIESTAQINVNGGLILSTLGINDAAFLAGINEIAASRQSDPAMILNESNNIHLDANSFLVMLSSAIKNTGDIAANGGTVIMAAGDKAVLSIGGDGLVNVEVTEPITAEVTDLNGNKISDVISNSGKITAGGGFVKLTAKGSEDLFDSIINHTGIIEAQTIGERDGKIVLDGGSEGVVRVNGTLDASGRDAGEKGGTVEVLGNKVGLFENAKIDVSGDTGGGEVLIGGDYQGKGDVRTADFTYMNESAKIWADALTSGNGGKVILWANNATRAYGTISAKGGALSGNGGFIETSGKEYLDVAGINVNASVPNGAAGQWLLDPYKITIGSSGSDIPLTGIFTAGSDSTVNASSINTVLNNGTNVTITASANNGDIELAAGFDLSKTVFGASSVVQLTLDATRDILIQGTIGGAALLLGVLNLVFQAGRNVAVNGAIKTNGGSVSIAGDGVDVNGAVNSGSGAIAVTGTSGDVKIGNALTTNNADITLIATKDVKLDTGVADIVTGGGKFTVNADSDDAGGGTFTKINTGSSVFTSGGDITASGSAIDINGVFNSGAGKIDLTAKSANVKISNALTTTGGDVTLYAVSGDVTLDNASSDIATSGGDITIQGNDFLMTDGDSSINAGSGNVMLKPSQTTGSIGVGTTVGTTFDISDAELDLITTTGKVIIGDVSNTGSIVVGGAEALSQNKNFDFITGNDVTFQTNAFSTSGNIVVSASDYINLTGANADITSTGGTITLAADADSSGSGNFVQNDAGSAVTTTNKAITISAQEYISSGTISAGSGDITLKPSQSIGTIGVGTNAGPTFDLYDAELDRVTTTGNIIIGSTGNTGLIDIGSSEALTQGAKNFQFLTGENIWVGGFNFTTTGNVTMTADADATGTGSIGAGTGVMNNINTLTLSAAQGIALNTTVNSLTAHVTGAGSLNIKETDGITLTDVDTANGPITITAGGAITAVDVQTWPDNDANDISITTTAGGIAVGSIAAGSGAAADVILNGGTGSVTDGNGATTNITADNLSLTAATGIDLDTKVNSLTAHVTGAGSLNINETDGITLTDVDTANGSLTVTAGGSVTASDVASLTDNNANDISITGAGIVAGYIIAGAGAAADVTLDATTGAITDGDGAVDVIADNLSLTAATSIDSDITVNSLTAHVTGAGSLNINETNGITLTDVDTANGSLTVTAGGAVTATDIASLTDNDANDISITTTAGGIAVGSIAAGAGAAADVILNGGTGAITDGDGAIDIIADDLTANAAIGIDLDTTVTNLTAFNTGAGNIAFREADGANVLSVFASSGNATVTSATGDLNVSILNATDGTATVTATTGAIMDNNGVTNNITATSLNATAATGIDLDTTITTLNLANVTGTGAIEINDLAGSLDVTSATTNNGMITISAAGGNLTVTALSAGTNGAVNLSTPRDIAVNDVSTGGKLTLTSGLKITQPGGAIVVTDLEFSATESVTLNQSANNFATVSGTTASDAINIADSGTNTEIKDLKTVGNTITYNHTGIGNVTVTGTVSSGDAVTNGGNIIINSSNALTIALGAVVSSVKGAGGVFTVGGATVLGTVTAGAGNITFSGTGLDTIISSAVTQATEYVISAARDIIVNAVVTTTNPSAQIKMTADSDLNGVGGVWVKAAGGLDSAGNVTLTGSSLFDASAAGESVRIDADGASNQVLAAGDIILQKSTAVLTTPDIVVNGIVKTTGGGKTITVNSYDQISSSDNNVAEFIGDNLSLTAKNGINIESDVVNASYANSTSGNVSIEDMTGGLTINGATNSGIGTTSILTHSPLTIAANMIQAGTINLTAGESAAANDHLTVDSGWTVQSTAGNVNLNAGDNVVLSSTSTVQSNTGAVNVTAGSGDTDDIGSVSLAGVVSAATTLTLTAITQVGGALGSINQTAGSVSAPDLVLNADDSATLSQATNSVTTLAATTGGAVTYQDTNAINLGNLVVGGALGVTAGGLIDFTGAGASTVGSTMGLTTTAGGINDSGTGSLAVTGTSTLNATGLGNDIMLDNAGNDFSTVTVSSGNNVTIKDVNNLNFSDATISGALALTADSDNNTAGATLATGNVSAASISLSGGTDNNDTIVLNGTTTSTAGSVVVDHASLVDINSDVTAATSLTVQNAATVDLAGNVDLRANNGALNAVTGVTQILLSGASATTNMLISNGDQAITLGAVNATNDVNLTVNSDGDVTLGNLDINAGNLVVNVDNNDNGANTGTFNDLTVNNLSISGHNATSPDENLTFNGAINMGGDLNVGGVGILIYNKDVTAKSINIHDISNRVQLGDNVDLTATNGILSVLTNVAKILLAGADGTINVFDGNGDQAVNLGPISATNNPNLTINSEGDINLTSANIGSGDLIAVVDNDNDGTNEGTFGTLTSGSTSVGGGSNDGLVFNGAIVTNTAGLTISNANNVDFNSTLSTATTLTQTAGSGTTTFNGNSAIVGTDASVTAGSIAFVGGGNINANVGTGAVTLNAGIGNITSGTAAADVTAGALKATAKTGINLNTAVDSVDLENATSGDIDIAETDAVSVLKAVQAIAGNISLVAGGSMTVVAGALANVVDAKGAGTILLDANGATSDLIVNDGIKSVNGDITLNAGNDVTFGADGDVTSTIGNVAVTADAENGGADSGEITMNGNTLIYPGSGKIVMTSDGDITLGGLRTTNSTTTAVTLTSREGGIVDAAGDTYVNVRATGGRLVVDAAAGIGSANAIETTIASLNADNTTSGNIDINETNALDILKIDQGLSAGTVNVDAGGTIKVTAGGSGVKANVGSVELDANGVASSLDIRNTIITTGGSVQLLADDDVTFTAAGDVSSANGNVTVQADADGVVSGTSGAVTMAAGTLIDAGSGTIDVDADEDITLGGLLTTSSLNTAVTLTTTSGGIVDGGDVYTNVDADSGRLVINAVTGVGNTLVAPAADKAIETQVNDLDVINGGAGFSTGSGDVNITELAVGGALNIMRVIQRAAAGKTYIQTQDGDLKVERASNGGLGIQAVDGKTTFYAANGGAGTDNLLIQNTINSADGKIQLFSDDNVNFTNAGDVTAGDASIKAGATGAQIEIEADTGKVDMSDRTLIDAGDGRIDIDARHNIILGGVKTSNTTNTAVVIVSRRGAIVDGGDFYTDIETGATGGMLLSAKDGIGSTTQPSPAADQGIETQGGKLAAFTESGDIQIFNTGALDITTIKDNNDPTSFFGNKGAGNVVGVTIKDPALLDPNSFIFITTASPMTISSAITNFDGGNISLYALGTTPGVDTMTVNNDVRTEDGNGDIRMVSGSSMTFAAGVTASTAGNGVISGAGNVIIGAGYDATGKAANQAAATLVGPGGTVGDAGADFTMASTSSVTTEDGDILVDVQDGFTIASLNADGGTTDLIDGVRGDITTFSRAGSTLDADLAATSPQLVNIYAETWNGTAGGSIGLSSNPIEANAPFQNLVAPGGVFVTNPGSDTSLINIDAPTGSIEFSTNGNILLGHAFAPNGQTSLTAGGSILSQGGGSTRVIANDVIRLIAGGVIGTASNHIQTQLNNAGNLFLEARGQQGALSANIQGNFTRASVQFLNTPPGLVSFNGIVIGGDTASLLEGARSSLYYNPNPVNLPAYGFFDGRYSADFPAFFDQNRFAFAPATSINTAGIDVLPIEGLGILPGIVPLPLPTPAPIPVPEAERPPLTVPLPGPATPRAVQPPQEQVPGPVFVAPGAGSDVATSSVSEPASGLAGDEENKKKELETAVAAGTPPLVVPVPVSAQSPVQPSSTENNNPPFSVNPLSQSVRMVRDRIQQMQSPIEQNEAANADAGSAPSPTGLGSEAASR